MSDQHTLTILVVPGCPHATSAIELTRDALAATGLAATIETVEVDDLDQAERLGFVGSPSFHLDGRDLFPRGSTPAMACRVYVTPAGPRGVPSAAALAAALTAAGTDG
ncbi:hypothetical protein [Antribacter gilvus]|uniref:hypothetical protein n=1 Tax=Antribacter gilvus TaxID=2304675 RepID=UPI00197EB1A7|nr:hypothetical protein [Antribacter gilvus]